MRDMIAVFTSRRDAIRFGTALAGRGVPARAVSTPSSAGSSCGLSVRFPSRAAPVARRVLTAGEYQSFRGFREL